MITKIYKHALFFLGLCFSIFAFCAQKNVCAETVFTDVYTNNWSYPVSREVFDDPYDVLRLINRDNLLEKDFPNQSVDIYKMVPVTVRMTNRDFKIRNIVNVALQELFIAAEAEDVELYVGSAYRTYRNQEVSYYNRVERMGYDDGIVQMAGASEHQAGLAADVVSLKYTNRFLQEFGETKEGEWLRNNCARFGFIIRYPADKEDITKVQYEPWHLRYVGIEAAMYIMESGLTLEEFTEEWQMEIKRYEER